MDHVIWHRACTRRAGMGCYMRIFAATGKRLRKLQIDTSVEAAGAKGTGTKTIY
jgi:hypothetical protein